MPRYDYLPWQYEAPVIPEPVRVERDRWYKKALTHYRAVSQNPSASPNQQTKATLNTISLLLNQNDQQAINLLQAVDWSPLPPTPETLYLKLQQLKLFAFANQRFDRELIAWEKISKSIETMIRQAEAMGDISLQAYLWGISADSLNI